MKEFSSFRDPSGYVFEENGILMRKIASSYLPEYRRLIESGLYRELVAGKLLVPHKELTKPDEVHGLVIQPLRIPMISYPYEWSFSMIQDAALLTLEIQKRALNHKMILKDASAYNVQFVSGRPVFIDTLSFEEYREGEPWGAYGQFCRHFLAPLLLMAHTDLRLNRLAELFLDGIPLDLASRLLRGKGGLFALIHIHLHARSISRHNQDNRMAGGESFSSFPQKFPFASGEPSAKNRIPSSAENLHRMGGILLGNQLFRCRIPEQGIRSPGTPCGDRSKADLGFRRK